MEGVIALVVLLLIIVIGIPIIIAANTNSKLSALRHDLQGLKGFLNNILSGVQELQQNQDNAGANDVERILQQIKRLEEKLEQGSVTETVTEQTPVPPIVMSEAVKPLSDEPEPGNGPELVPEPEPLMPEFVPETVNLQQADPIVHATEAPADDIIATSSEPIIVKSRPKTNFEQFIGEKLISIAGIAILVLGIIFSVKWAIDRNLISDGGKVLIGIFSGTALIGIAHRLTKNYRTFSSILAGGGIAVLYFSIYEAYQAYHLVNQTIAFLIVVLITGLAVILSLIYDKKELAIIGIVGGFCTPFLVSNGSGNFQVLFSYLLILNIGMFLLAYFKKWDLLNIICYVFTLLIFSGWTSNKALPADAGYGFLFTVLFYLVFFGMHTIYNLRHRKAFGFVEIVLLLSNSFVHLGFGLYFLQFIRAGAYQGMYTLSLAAFNCLFAYVFYRRSNVDRNFILLLIGLTLTFLSLTAPLQLDGNYITLFWASELVLMYWLGQRTGIVLLKNASPLLLAFTCGSLLRDWSQEYNGALTLIFNKAFLTTVVVVIAIALLHRFTKQDRGEKLLWGNLPVAKYHQVLSYLFILLLYVGMFLEAQHQSLAWSRSGAFQTLVLCSYHLAFVLGCALFYSRKAMHNASRVAYGILSLSLFCYLLPATPAIAALRNLLLIKGSPLFYGHYLMTFIVVAALFAIGTFIRKNFQRTAPEFNIASWLISFIVVYLISAETLHLWVAVSYRPGFPENVLTENAYKVGFPIVWSICSLTLMLLGMRYRVKTWRIISLSVFLVTTIKLFTYDISNVGQGGKIAAFIILGIILLVVSFMYQKIKGLFKDDEKNEME